MCCRRLVGRSRRFVFHKSDPAAARRKHVVVHGTRKATLQEGPIATASLAGKLVGVGPQFPESMKTVDLETSETLKNGVTVHIRSVRPGDKAGIVEVFGELRPESVYTRFFQHKASLSPQELETATEVDPDHGVALVATVESGGRQRIVAGGRYVTIDPSSPQPRAEIAFLVAEDFHGLGLAGRILQHLARIARQRSVHQFEAAVLPQNKAMLAVFSRSGLPMKQLAADGMVYVTLSLLEPSGTALT